MAAINTSISYQSQFASAGASLNDMRTKGGPQAQMEEMKGVQLKPTNFKFQVQKTEPLGDLGRHVNLKA
jgi:hypothetical protein